MAAKRHGYGARPSGGRRGSRGLFENSSDSSRAHRAGFNDAHIVDENFFLRFAQFFGTFPSFSNVGGVRASPDPDPRWSRPTEEPLIPP